ncbi:RDD family protein [Paenibacillus sp. An7]|uniref:RDD family protein n=1 Tax=Paenibacillus sp. An7 TaxID=2689577 RepID=UPI00135A01CD|nr:RDD family protein [Paenibacillus sp. An7]
MVSEPAGFWSRFFAGLLDGIIVGLPLYILSNILTGSTDDNWVTQLLLFLYSLLLPVFWGGCTIGKRLCGIKIQKVSDEGPPGIGTMLLRNLVASFVYGITLGIGWIISLFMVVFREDKRAIHDFIAGTEVVQFK